MKKILISVMVAVFAITAYAQAPDVPLKDKPINELVEYWSDYYDIDSERFSKIIYCESRYKPTAINYHDGGKGKHSVGILQFQKSTFDYWSGVLGEKLDYYSYYDQIKLGAFMISKGQINQWSCNRLVK